MFPLKQQGLPQVKEIIVASWGALCQKDDRKVVTEEGKEVMIPINCTVHDIIPCFEDDDKDIVMYSSNVKMYKTDFARISPFVTSRGRYDIGELMKPFLKSIVRVQTDGIITTEKLDIKYGNGLGEVKYEGYCKDLVIVHVNKLTDSKGDRPLWTLDEPEEGDELYETTVDGSFEHDGKKFSLVCTGKSQTQ